MKRNSLLLLISVVILLCIGVFIVYSCSCYKTENFIDINANDAIVIDSNTSDRIDGTGNENISKNTSNDGITDTTKIDTTKVQKLLDSANKNVQVSSGNSDEPDVTLNAEGSKSEIPPVQSLQKPKKTTLSALGSDGNMQKGSETSFKLESLSAKEKELFQSVIENNISSEKIQELIKSGILTDKLVEKFLNYMDKLSFDGKIDFKNMKGNTVDNGVEGFSGSYYAAIEN